MSHLLLELETARTTGTNSFVLCGEIRISGLLNDLMASHYCLEFPVCMYAHSLEQGHLFLSTRKNCGHSYHTQAICSGACHEMYTLHEETSVPVDSQTGSKVLLCPFPCLADQLGRGVAPRGH